VRATDGATLAEHLPEATAAGVIQRREAALDVAFVSGAAAAEPRFAVAEAALRQGRHVFLEWPPAASAEELEQLAARAEEAGAEGGVSRPLRFHPLFDAVPANARADVVTVRARLASDSGTRDRRRALSDALDLCGVLAGSRAGRPGAGVRHLDAQAAPAPADEDDNNDARFGAVTAGLRFHGGTYATLELRRAAPDEAAPPDRRLYAAGPGFRLDADLDDPEHASPETLLQRETQAFLQALVDGEPPPVSLLDARPAMRLTERIMQRLRR
jgi:predicted dehydrogenase